MSSCLCIQIVCKTHQIQSLKTSLRTYHLASLQLLSSAVQLSALVLMVGNYCFSEKVLSQGTKADGVTDVLRDNVTVKTDTKIFLKLGGRGGPLARWLIV